MTTGGFDPQYDAPRNDRVEAGALLPRFFARVIDGFLVGIVGFAIGIVTDTWSNIMVTGLFPGLLMFVYFVAFEVTQGWTPGKKLLGLSVHGPAGAQKPDLKQSAIRNGFTLLSSRSSAAYSA